MARPSVVSPPGTTRCSRRAQQTACDRWLVEFNEVRPHDALGGKTRAEVYSVRERRPVKVRIPVYPPEWITRRVNADGRVAFLGGRVQLSSALVGQLVGLRHEGALRWHAYFFEVDLGVIELADLGDLDPGELRTVWTVTPESARAATPVTT